MAASRRAPRRSPARMTRMAAARSKPARRCGPRIRRRPPGMTDRADRVFGHRLDEGHFSRVIVDQLAIRRHDVLRLILPDGPIYLAPDRDRTGTAGCRRAPVQRRNDAAPCRAGRLSPGISARRAECRRGNARHCQNDRCSAPRTARDKNPARRYRRDRRRGSSRRAAGRRDRYADPSKTTSKPMRAAAIRPV